MDFPPPDLFIRPQYMPLPIPWNLIRRYDKLIVELGFGRGEYLLTLSQSFPNALIVGFEVSMTSLLKASYRLKSNNIDNVKLLLFDGVLGLSEFFEESSVDYVYMNFPVPWPKKKHAKRRVIRPVFWKTLARVLKVDGCFELMTDVEWYARNAFGNSSNISAFKVVMEHNPVRRVKTKYEEKWLSQGKDIYLVSVCKHREIDIPYKPLFIKGADFMPHIVIRKPWDMLRQDLLMLENTETTINDNLKYGVREIFLRDREALLRSYTIDDGFFQSFYVWVRPEDKEGSNVYLIKLDPISSPFRTRALMGLMKYVKNTIGDTFVVRHNLG